VRDVCLLATRKGGQFVRVPASKRKYQCGFENVGTVPACPKRRRLKEDHRED
jgi:hypothetical protein